MRERQRCHTACRGCRAARSRCGGTSPCATCQRNSLTCVYDATSRARTSRHDTTRSSSSIVPQPVNANANATDAVATPTSDSSAALQPSDIPGTDQPLDLDDSMTLLAPQTTENALDFTLWPFPTGWQWTHEDLYLQVDSTLTSSSDMSASNLLTNSLTAQAPMVSDTVLENGTPRASRTASPTLHGSGSRHAGRSLNGIIHDMIEFATQYRSESVGHASRSTAWCLFSSDLSLHVSIGQTLNTAGENFTLLDDIIDKYFEHFSPLWAMVPRDPNAREKLHPFLYLTLTSIGALYCGSTAAVYGSKMHEELRAALLQYSWRTDQTEVEALDIGRAMLLTQIAALYFEQNGAFSAAHQLGATLNTHAQRMRLFAARQVQLADLTPPGRVRDTEIVEGRKMLAYGMLRVETFMSVLFARKPSVVYEEINLHLPFTKADSKADHAWGGLEPSLHSGIIFSDLVRLALDPREVLPALQPANVELLLFGLQYDVWRFSHDPDLFLRLLNARRPRNDAQGNDSRTILQEVTDDRDHLNCARRVMTGLVSDYDRVLSALGKWKQLLSVCQLTHHPDQHRSTYLSALILFELSHLRLCAPIDAVQQTAYQMHGSTPQQHEGTAQVRAWTYTVEAKEAVEHARQIWKLLEMETSRMPHQQARYNILALIALHHAAVILWAIAGTDAQPDESVNSSLEFTTRCDEMKLRRENTHRIMTLIAHIYPRVTSSWGIQSSFCKIVLKLANHPFPSLDSDTQAVRGA